MPGEHEVSILSRAVRVGPGGTKECVLYGTIECYRFLLALVNQNVTAQLRRGLRS